MSTERPGAASKLVISSLFVNLLGALEEEERVLVVPDGVKDDGNVAVTGCHFRVILTKHQQEKVTGSKENTSVVSFHFPVSGKRTCAHF